MQKLCRTSQHPSMEGNSLLKKEYFRAVSSLMGICISTDNPDNAFCVQGIDLKLKNVSAMGVYGWNSICETVAAEWLEDISKNQVLISLCTILHLGMAFCCIHANIHP